MIGPCARLTERLAAAIIGAQKRIANAVPAQRDRFEAEFISAAATVDRYLNDASTVDVHESECISALESVGKRGW